MKWAIIYIVLEILGFLSAIRAIYYARRAEGAIAWAISLVTLPIIALPMYWLLSTRNFYSYVKLKRSNIKKFKNQYVPYSEERRSYEVREDIDERLKLYSKIAGTPVLKYNNVELLANGQETFPKMFECIEQAKEYILAQFFIIECNELGEKFINLLCKKAQEGIATYLMYDGIGSSDFPSKWRDRLEAAGAKVGIFAMMKSTLNPLQINFRNHRKLLVVDGEAAFVGGLNIGSRYIGSDSRLTPWRDTMMAVRGPACLECQALFYEDWYWATNEILNLSWTTITQKEDSSECIVAGSGPADEYEIFGPLVMSLILGAKTRVWLTTPYFIADDRLVGALKLAVKKGVDVRLLFPKNSDHHFVWLASQTYLQDIASEGVKVYLYKEGFMHQKVILVDDDIAMIGSGNLDYRSLFLNFELGIIAKGREFAARVRAMLEQDFEVSELVGQLYFSERSWIFRFVCKFTYLFSSVL